MSKKPEIDEKSVSTGKLTKTIVTFVTGHILVVSEYILLKDMQSVDLFCVWLNFVYFCVNYSWLHWLLVNWDSHCVVVILWCRSADHSWLQNVMICRRPKSSDDRLSGKFHAKLHRFRMVHVILCMAYIHLLLIFWALVIYIRFVCSDILPAFHPLYQLHQYYIL